MKRLVAGVLVVAALAGAAAGEEKFRYPPPDLGPDYVQPRTSFPAVRETLPAAADIALLVTAILLASYFALKLRSRLGIWCVCAASLAYFGFVRGGCVCPIGAIQNVAAAMDPRVAISMVVVAFFVIPLIATLLFGRTFCAAVCPLGAIQDVVLVHPVRVPAWLAGALGLLPVAYLSLAVVFAVTGAGYVICRYDPFVSLFRLSGSANMLILGGSFLVISLFVGRPYCRFLCPYGVLLGWLSRLSQWRVTITPDECVQCGLCENACPFGAIRKPNADQLPRQRSAGRAALVWTLSLAPVLVVGGGWLGRQAGPAMARVHATVWLAERVRMEEDGQVKGTTDASDAFRESGRLTEALYADASVHRGRIVLGGTLAGAFIALIAALKLIALSVRRTRTDYEADRGTCLACGRCFDYCPVELRRRKQRAKGGAIP